MSLTRGDIYYVDAIGSVGSEQRGGRPAIIVSNDKCNQHSPVVEVVYLTTAPKSTLPTHVTVRSAPRVSTALCEQVHSVDTQRLGDYCGSCTPQELSAVDMALLISLGLDVMGGGCSSPELVESATDVGEKQPVEAPELIAVRAQLDLLRQMYDSLLHRVAKTDDQ